jgi:fumarylacetoacetate (FAA) hydrolase
MKLITFLNKNNAERLGIFSNNNVYDLQSAGSKLGFELPSDILSLLNGGEKLMDRASVAENKIISGGFEPESGYELIAPVPHPPSCRDGYAFRQHVEAARRNRGVEMIPEFDQYPIFYFTNHHSIIGGGDVAIELDHLQKLDFELELAAVIGKRGRNIDSKNADSYIAGYTIMNDLSARTLQMEEMLLSLGPAKGKDFATAIGPWLVTPDEMEQYRITTEFGNLFNLRMTAKHNGELISDGNAKDMTWTFAEIIERASYGVDIFPGDVIGSGTVGTGCYLELNGTRARLAREKGEEYTPVWLKNDDIIELEITGLGTLTNKMTLTDNNISILSKKKNI